MRILLCTVRLGKSGGVANYYSVIQPYFSEDIEYFTVGARTDSENLVRVCCRLLIDYYNFIRKLNQKDFDLVHINPSLDHKGVIRDGVYLLIAKLFRKRTVVFFRGWDLEFEQFLRMYFFPLFRFAYNKADAFVVLSPDFEKKLIDMGFRQPVFLETTIVDDAIFKRREAESLSKAESDSPSFNILFLSRIERAKGIYEALDTYKILKERHKHITMTIAGDGSEFNRARQYADSLRTAGIEFRGDIRGEAKHMAFIRADAYFFPSYGEGMPNALLEAMAYGLPLVTRPVGGIRNFFEDHRMGFATESKDPVVFAQLFEKIIQNKELRLSISAFNRQYASEHFMASKVAKRIENIYREIVCGARH